METEQRLGQEKDVLHHDSFKSIVVSSRVVAVSPVDPSSRSSSKSSTSFSSSSGRLRALSSYQTGLVNSDGLGSTSIVTPCPTSIDSASPDPLSHATEARSRSSQSSFHQFRHCDRLALCILSLLCQMALPSSEKSTCGFML